MGSPADRNGKTAGRRRVLACLLLAALAGPLSLVRAQVPQPSVDVYRDEHGVPHIVAESEEAAWYALGYEQARDGLLWIQYACRAAKGELLWVRGDAAGLQNDIAVKILGAHLGGLSQTQLRTLLQPANPAFQANFYDNCIAFAAGANDYRVAVKNAAATPQTPEGRLRAWLASGANRFPSGQGNLAWVYDDVIHPVDIASQGAWTTALWSFYRAEITLVNSNGIGYTDGETPTGAAVDPEMVGDLLATNSTPHLLEQMRQYASGAGGMASAMSGSNSFGWSGLYCRDPATGIRYAGLLADPHQGLPFFSPNFMADFGIRPNHLWFAHVRVTPPGATQPTLDVFGHVPHASAAFLSSHNRTLAMGGTAGVANFTDHFLLRLQEDSQGMGTAQTPHRFYSYYHDSTPPTNATFQPISQHTLSIRRPDNQLVPLHYWRAQSFGFILPDLLRAGLYVAAYPSSTQPPEMPILHGERVDPGQPPPRWRVDTRANPAPSKMRYWASPQFDGSNSLITSPMVVSVRVPMDAAVAGNPLAAGEDRHWQLTRDFWEISHATSVLDVYDRTNGGGYPVNVCFADSAGRTLSTQLSAIPERGDDGAIAAAGYSSMDKFVFYSLTAGPVPARHAEDRMFDWRFSGFANPARPAQLRYLPNPPPGAMRTVNWPFKAVTLQDPTPGGQPEFPPTSWSGSGSSFRGESGYFAAACNDPPWGYSRRRDAIAWNNNPTGPHGLNNLTTDNWLLGKVLDHGAAYQAWALWFEPLATQQIVVDRFTRMAERIVTPPHIAGLPPLLPAEAREFVVSPRMFSATDYVPPSGVTADPSLPTPIRQLREVVDNPTHPLSPLERGRREIGFFRDLWAELFDPNSQWNSHQVQGQPGTTVSLRDLWVYGNVPNHTDQVFWYRDPNNPATLQWIDMPSEFPLIDFLWTESEFGRDFTVGATIRGQAVTVLPGTEPVQLSSLVHYCLVPWGPGRLPADRYRNEPSSDGACLLEMMRMGYNGRNTFGRKWVWLNRGQVRPAGAPSWTPLTATGQLPSGTGALAQRSVGWSKLAGLAFPISQHTTLFGGGLEVPYDALYDPSGQVWATLSPAATNALVEFFLKLGGHHIDPAHNGNNPSRKLARWELANHDPDVFMSFLPGSYPLTAGLERLTVVRALLDTGAFLGKRIPQFRQHFRARAYDHNGQQLWPQTLDADYVGGGLRSVVWHEDRTPGSDFEPDRGYQPKFLGMGGSYATLLALFPSQGGVESYFWCTPGVEAMGADPSRFTLHMAAHAANTLMRSHFSDFATNHASRVTHNYPATQ